MRILALDPGGTTGFKIWSDEVGFVGGQLINGHMKDGHHEELWSMLNNLYPTVVIYEAFEYRNRARAGLVLDSREYIGIIRLWGEITDGAVLVKQTASQAKGFVNDAILKKGSLWVPGNPHENDAMRHLVYYLVNGKHGLTELRTKLLKELYKSTPL